jgi:hypothetical protein
MYVMNSIFVASFRYFAVFRRTETRFLSEFTTTRSSNLPARNCAAAMPNGINGSLGVMLGDGTGHFAAPAKLFPLGSQPVSISVGDLNHDGKLDAVVANFGVFTPPASVFVLLGNGDGTFRPATQLASVPKNAAPIDVEFADLNGDGNLDIVVSNNNEVYASVYLGKGDGTFQAPTKAYTAFAPAQMIIQDYNGDGIPDIAFLSGGEGDAGVLVGKGDGTFRPVVFFGAGVSPLLIGTGTLVAGGKPGFGAGE